MDKKALMAAYQASLAQAVETGLPVKVTLCKPMWARGAYKVEVVGAKAMGGPLQRGIRPAGFGTNVARWNRVTSR